MAYKVKKVKSRIPKSAIKARGKWTSTKFFKALAGFGTANPHLVTARKRVKPRRRYITAGNEWSRAGKFFESR